MIDPSAAEVPLEHLRRHFSGILPVLKFECRWNSSSGTLTAFILLTNLQ